MERQGQRKQPISHMGKQLIKSAPQQLVVGGVSKCDKQQQLLQRQQQRQCQQRQQREQHQRRQLRIPADTSQNRVANEAKSALCGEGAVFPPFWVNRCTDAGGRMTLLAWVPASARFPQDNADAALSCPFGYTLYRRSGRLKKKEQTHLPAGNRWVV